MKKSNPKNDKVSKDNASDTTPDNVNNDNLNNTLNQTQSDKSEASNFIRVGCIYFKKLLVKNVHGESEIILKPWHVAEIKRDSKASKTFFDLIEKYDAFCNIPDHTYKYTKVVRLSQNGIKSKLYNRYHPLNHNISEGKWDNIEKFLLHIFNYKNIAGENLYDFGLDYIQLLYTAPMQRLPILCLTSDERGTGKSTFLELMQLIFKDNCAILDNETFSGKNTSHFVDKLIIGLDEGFIPIEQKLMMERIKNMSSGRRTWLETKGNDAVEIDFFGKLIFCSNDENNFNSFDYDMGYFTVIKISSIQKEDPMLLQKMKNEIGHFIFFLLNRKLHFSEKLSRFWFNLEVFLTK